ncbi:MAG: GNAT family N-acetyltransferase [Prevotella sp.]|jgi:diamine N-acetyltransferase|nr:GNAT family N-acetyltransferase [Prevotella sp.]
MLLENDILKLRPLEPEDLDVLYKWENDTRLWVHGHTLSPYSKMALRQYITNAMSQDIYQNRQLRLMIDLKKEPKTIGTVDLYDLDIRNLRAGIGILIDENCRNKDFARESLELVKEYAFSFLHLHQLYAYIMPDNLPSIQLFEKAGFTKSSLLKDWVRHNAEYADVAVYQNISE